jgi:energy-coupling factor transporter ATP-binding protein EcfA2
MARLKSVAIRRFKCIEQIEIPLDAVTLLIGANNSGKSSILQAIHFAVSIAQTARFVGEGVAWRQDTFELSFNPSQLLYSPVADVLSLATGGRLLEQRPSQIEIEFRAEDGARTVVGLRRGRNRNIAVSIEGRTIGEQLMSLPQPFTVYAPRLAGVPKEERYMSPGVVRRIVARGDANLTLRNVLRMLKDDLSGWTGFIASMQSIFPEIQIEIDFDADTDENIEVFFKIGNGARLPIDAAGTSVLQASQLLAYISLFRPQVLILDEPDSHLHPDNQRALWGLVSALAAERGFQAIISTHSRHVLDSMRSRGKVIWLSKGSVVDQTDINTTAVLLDLGALDSVDYFADGELRCVVVTEDTEMEAIKAILWSNDFIEADTEVASYAGCSNAEAAIVLGRFLTDRAAHVRLVVHRDRDYMSQSVAEIFEDHLAENNIKPFLTDGNDIESYFISAAHLHALNPMVSAERIQQLIDQATADTEDQSISAMVNLRTQEAYKSRRAGQPQPNHGQISVHAHADYAASPAAHRRGTIVLGRLVALLQQEIRQNPRIFFATPHLKSPRITAIAQTIWSSA